MKRNLVILFVISLIFSNQPSGQVVEEASRNYFDSIPLSQDCKILEQDPSNKVFTKTEIIAAFPGDGEKWFEFANKNFDFDYVLQKISDSIKRFEDSLIVKFIVTKEGNLCTIRVLKGNSILAEPIIKLLKASPNWKPASSNRNLNAYRTLRIDVLLDKRENIKEIKRTYKSYFRYND